MNQRMVRTMMSSLEHIDVVMLIVDASISMGGGERFALELVSRVKSRKFLLLNKVDKVRKRDLLPMIERSSRACEFDEIVPISALKKDGTGELKTLLFDYLPQGPLYYPTDQPTDQPERFLVAEIVREKLILETRQELPHATAVAIDRFDEGESLVRIYASVYVERESQKAIVIGKGGALLKQAGTSAREEIETLLNTKVHLELHVKVRRKWRDDDQMLESLGL
jgi:GTP-binding protein Era